MRPVRAAALAAGGVLAASVLLLPWYSLGEYEPSGWDASFWLRLALVVSVLNLIAVRADGPATGSVPLAAVALAAVALRVALPPDFGLDFDGLDVPVERRVGAWIGLAAASGAFVAALFGRTSGPQPVRRAGGW